MRTRIGLSALILSLGMFALPCVSPAQTTTTFLEYRSAGYTYSILRPSASAPRNWQTVGYDDSRWAPGAGSFGTTTLPGTPPCPLNDPAIVRTDWPQSRDLLVRRSILLPAGARSVRVAVAIDNNLQVFFNGVDISGGILAHDVCAAPGDYLLAVPDSLLRSGTNILAARGYWQSGQSYLDFRVTGVVSYTITASAGPNGVIAPSGVVTVQAGDSRAFAITPNTGYELDSLLVDGVRVDSTTSYTFTNVTANRTIRAVFKIRRYAVTATAGPNGSISPSGTIVVNHGDSVAFTIAPSLYYVIEDVLVNGSSVGPVTAWTFRNVTAPQTIAASFFSTSVVVSSLADSGTGTFREAIGITNADPDLDTIKFALPGTGVRTITLSSSLPIVIDSLVIDGTTQPFSFGPALGPENTSGPLIELNGNGVAQHGLILAASNVVVRGLVINRCTESGILVLGANARIEGNYLGTDPTGTIDRGNGRDGILVNGAAGTRIGAPGPAGTNLLSGNDRNGVRLENASGTVIENNLIGTDLTGTGALGNGAQGVAVVGGLPGIVVGPGNTVSGNGDAGVALLGAAGAAVRGNRIGTRITSSLPLPNAGDGVLVDSLTALPAGNVIGGTGAGNTIAFNGGNGVHVRRAAGTRITGNRITDNGLLGIDVGGNGLTPPALQLTFAAFDLKTIGGVFAGNPLTAYTLEFYDNESPDPGGFGEGRTPLGTAEIMTDAAGTAPFYVSVSGPMNSYRFVTATVTDPSGATSEFSGALQSVAKVKIFGDHYVVNTTFSGIPLHWPEGTSRYQISTSIPADFHDAVGRGFAAWNNLPDLNIAFDGETPAGTWGGDADGRNLAVWVTDGWEQLTGLDSNAVAVTRVRYNAFTGLITDADVAYNAEHFPWEEAAGGAAAASLAMDVENVTAHEGGHVQGLGDIFDPGDPGYVSAMGTGNAFVTMYGLIAGGETSKRSIESPDSAGISFIYDNVPPSSVDLVLVFDPSASYAIGQTAFEPSRNSALELLPKMRQGDRLGIVLMPSTVVLPLTPMGDSTGRAAAAAALASITPGGTASAIGSGLQTAQAQLSLSPSADAAPAVLLFSAGEENTAPGALGVLGPILNAGTRIFTLGFPGSYGQDLANQLADTTGGGYFLAVDTTVNQAVNEIWNVLSGAQYSYFTVASSDTFTNAPFPGIQWQGPVDKGSTSALPGIQWQGPKTATLSAAGGPEGTAAAQSSYVLTLLPPGGPFIDSAFAAANPGLGIRFFGGSTYQYFSVQNPTPGIWSLYAFQRSGPPAPEPVVISIAANTDLVMLAAIADLDYLPGQQVSLKVELANGGVVAGQDVVGGAPITDALVSALITPPGGGTPATVTLNHQGGGEYRGSFAGTSVPGTYEVTFTARKDTVQRTAAQSFYVVPEFNGRAVLLANRSITMDAGAVVASGDVIVNSTRQNSVYELVLAGAAATPAGFAVKASDILVNTGATIAGDVSYNTLVNNGSVTGTLSTPLALPVFSALPPFRTAVPGTTPVSVRKNRVVTLAPGAYGDVSVEPGGTLVLSGGTYHVRSVIVKSKAKLTAAAAAEVRVAQGFNADNEAYIGPAQGSLIDARGLVIYVAGADNTFPNYPSAVTISPYGTVFANIYAPYGSVGLRQGATATGAFIANDLLVGQGARVSLASAFAPGQTAPVPWTLEPGTGEAETTAPLTFALDQNYPNPFNPSTSIRFELAEPRFVTLEVFDELGRTIRTLVREERAAGGHIAVWDGRNDAGLPVGSGVFITRLTAGAFTQIRSMLLLK